MTLAETLGLGRAVILHIDDLAMCHGANRAFLDLARAGLVTSGSVMVPCPWFREIAEAASGDAALDLGVHLTLTSEWRHYRWRPISTTSRASGLIDGEGYFWRDVASLRAHLVPEAAEPSCGRRSSLRSLPVSRRPISMRTWLRQCCPNCSISMSGSGWSTVSCRFCRAASGGRPSRKATPRRWPGWMRWGCR